MRPRAPGGAAGAGAGRSGTRRPERAALRGGGVRRGAYGDTISPGGAALAVGALGPPGLGEVVVMMAGAVAAFVLLRGSSSSSRPLGVVTATAQDRLRSR